MTATTSPSGRRYGRFRRVEAELALRLPLEPFRRDPVASYSLNVGRETASTLFATPDTGSATSWLARDGVEPEDPESFSCTLVLGSAASVALEEVDARSVARPNRGSSAVTELRRAGTRRASARSEPSLAERLLLVLQPPLEALLESQGLLEWPSEIRPYQLDGVRSLMESDALLLADDMGLGKTIQAIAAIRVLVHLRRAARVLVVAPASLLSQWQRELTLWAPELRAEVVRAGQQERLRMWARPRHVHIVSYETLRQDTDPQSRYGPSAIDWDAVVLDEAQKIKNRSTNLSRVCKSLTRRRAWALTGTPLENSIDDLQSIIEFLSPLAAGEVPPPVLYGERLLERHGELQLRRRKADVLKELPAKSVNDIWLRLATDQRAHPTGPNVKA